MSERKPLTEEQKARKKEYGRQRWLANKSNEEEQAKRRAHREANAEHYRAYSRKWKEENRERNLESGRKWKAENRDRSRDNDLKRKYGITFDQKKSMLEEQSGCCAICSTKEPGISGWSTDHCHSTGRLRKILCGHCNSALGFMKDSPERLRAAASYIESHR